MLKKEEKRNLKKCKVIVYILVSMFIFTGCGQKSDTVGSNTEGNVPLGADIGSETVSGTKTDETSDLEQQSSDENILPVAAEEAVPQEKEISMVMVGDILLHTPVAESGMQADGSYNFDAVFAHLKEDIQSADVALVNQEVIIGGAELGVSGYPAFNAPYELGDALVNSGFDVVLHATNHALDKGRSGLMNCLNFWQEHYPDMAVLGINESEEARNEIYIYEQEGIRIAILNYTYGTNGIPLPSDMPFAVNLLDEESVRADLQRAGENADFVVVCPHWGTEYTLAETEEQHYWAQIFYENGADLVIGTHPHVIEPIQWYGEGDNKMLVYYSLGNFVNWTSSEGEGIANRMVGGMADVTIAKDAAGNTYIKDYTVEPVVCHVEDGAGQVTVYPLDEYTKELADRNQIIRQDGNFSLDYCKELCRQVWGNIEILK